MLITWFLLSIMVACTPSRQTDVLQTGHYAPLHISGKNDVTYKCSVAGACTMSGGTMIRNSSNIVIDGFKVVGAANGITIRGSDNVTIKNSRFIEQEGAGVTIRPQDGTNHNIEILNNSFENDRTGCQYTRKSNCTGYMPDGSPVAYMDYGLQVWSTDGILVQGNQFGSLFNHAISLKYGVNDATIVDNRFNGCGRNCIEVGQQYEGPVTTGTDIHGNTFKGKANVAIYLKNQRDTHIGDNTIDITGRGQKSDYDDTPGGGGPAEPPYVYVPPVIEDAEHRRDRMTGEGSADTDARRLRVIGEGPAPHNCCDDPDNPIDASVNARRLRMQQAGPTPP
jgi:hypothetical protein